jgi:hypothetical protein
MQMNRNDLFSRFRLSLSQAPKSTAATGAAVRSIGGLPRSIIFLCILIGCATMRLSAQPVPVSLTPSSGSGGSQVFTAVFSDPKGGADISEADMYVMSGVVPGSGSGWSAHECIVRYQVATGAVAVVIDAGGKFGVSAVAGGVSSNSQCTIFGSGSSATVSGNTLTVKFNIVFDGSDFSGAKQLYLFATNSAGQFNANFNQQLGSWTIPAQPAVPAPVSISPSSGNSAMQTFTATFTDPNGASNVQEADMYIMNNVVPGSASGWSGHECIVRLDPGTNNMYLVVDAGGSYSSPVTLGSNSLLQNSQCTVAAFNSSKTLSGNTLTVNFAVYFNTTNFSGAKQLYLIGSNAAGDFSTNYQNQLASFTVPAFTPIAVTTYHYDNRRTGWNNGESALTPSNMASGRFALQHTVALNDQVDAQSLVVPGVTIAAGADSGTVHDVVYVVTESDTVYAIDAHSGAVLLTNTLGPPVPKSALPGQCGNNGPNVGITSTPVIDLSTNTLFVMAYTNDGPTYRLHALGLGNLTDQASPMVVSASHGLSPAGTFQFNAKYQRQRPALLFANGSIYAGFGSFCDVNANLSRGWLLGWSWNATSKTFTDLAADQLFDFLESSPNNFFLSSVWMSGYGPAADDSGNILFVTGNSDPSGTTYTGSTNIQESVVKLSPSLSSVVSLFTPSDWPTLDKADTDFGSGGVMVLPDQPGSVPHLAVAAGKDGNMYLMNADSLGGYSPTGNNVLGTYSIGSCWCGESYYLDELDHLARVVSSGAQTLEVWKLQTSPNPALSEVESAALPSSVQGPGFFTSVSSNAGINTIIWAISRPSSSTSPTINLLAFDPDPESGSGLHQLVNINAGTWPNLGGNANLVPVVANGLVYVASYKQLQIFGLNP